MSATGHGASGRMCSAALIVGDQLLRRRRHNCLLARTCRLAPLDSRRSVCLRLALGIEGFAYVAQRGRAALINRHVHLRPGALRLGGQLLRLHEKGHRLRVKAARVRGLERISKLLRVRDGRFAARSPSVCTPFSVSEMSENVERCSSK